MTNLVITDSLIVLLILSNIVGQWYFRNRPADTLAQEKKPEIKPTVTRTSPGFINDNHALKEESAIVEPKTPQQIAWEEQEELRKMQFDKR